MTNCQMRVVRLTSEQLQGTEDPRVFRRLQDVRQERRRRRQKHQCSDHCDRDADSHRDRTGLPPGARYVPEASMK